ncbi:FecCD family ABC transporter permease [Streptoalloteichus hindustanus]|uniref:Iron complex transport system permease protein n=1 Tax=Streptoalloteichus hindustanus TaxID=2017 RepID=A0A1M5CUC2_STRHI|nr:iron ABC transporter permease [Streptoalloteichus hindustanus]SHF58304.1 iron complex transport system permease protein [Streptoalloteichus hindustanus]
MRWLVLAAGLVAAGFVVSGLVPGEQVDERIVLELRLPRVLVGLGAGACLGIAGAVMQAVLRNPLAAPEATGVGSGAVLGAVVVTVFGGAATSPVGVIATAVLGGVVGGGVLWVIAARAGSDPVRLAVVGVLVSAVLAGLTLVLLTARPQLAGSMTRWLVGSLNGRTWEHWAALWPCLLAVAVAAVLLAPVLEVLAVDDDHARVVGLAVGPWRSAVLLLAVMATAAAVATTGALAFVGLLAPHAARSWVGADPRVAVPVSAVFGAGTVTAADSLAQAVPGVPTGAVTALLGACVLVMVARRTSGGVA